MSLCGVQAWHSLVPPATQGTLGSPGVALTKHRTARLAILVVLHSLAPRLPGAMLVVEGVMALQWTQEELRRSREQSQVIQSHLRRKEWGL